MYHDSTNAPALDKTVLDRLKRLDSNVKLTYSRFVINPMDGSPLAMHVTADWYDHRPEVVKNLVKFGNNQYVLDPAWHLWAWTGEGRWYLIKSYPAAQGFGHREVMALEGDAARWMKPSEIVAQAKRLEEEKVARQKAKYAEVRKEVLKENETRIKDYIYGKQDTDRDGKLFSYGGQSHRGSTGKVERDSKEDGWVKPTLDDYR